MSIALCPGSFDPVTLGHLDLVARAAGLFDRVYLCAMRNADKGDGFLTEEERVELLRLAAAPYPNVTVDFWGGLAADYAHRVGATALVKGVRNADDLTYELKLAAWNRAYAPDLETVLLPAKEELAFLSSTLLRERLAAGADIDAFVPPAVAKWFSDRKGR